MASVIKFVGQLFEIKSRKDGGSRIVIECGFESMNAILELQKLNGQGETNLAIAVAPFDKENIDEVDQDLEPDFKSL